MSDLSDTALHLIAPETGADVRVSEPGRVLSRRPTARRGWHWPAPPQPAFAGAAAEVGNRPVEIDLRDGTTVSGLLNGFDPADELARIVVPPERTATPMRFAKIACIRLEDTLTPASATDWPGEGDGDLQRDEVMRHRSLQPFRIDTVDGRHWSGHTAGHVEHDTGWFLFPLACEASGAVSRWFVPRSAVREIRVGERLGTLLAKAQPEVMDDIEEVARVQISLREQRLGEALMSAQVVDFEQLLEALDKQARMPEMRLGEALLSLGHVDAEQLEAALAQQRSERSTPIGELLLQRGLVTLPQIRAALAEKLGYPVVDVARFPVEPAAVQSLSVDTALRLGALPLVRQDRRLVVAMEDPSRRSPIEAIEQESGCQVVPALAGEGDLAAVIQRVYAVEVPPSVELVHPVERVLNDAVQQFSQATRPRRGPPQDVPVLRDVAMLEPVSKPSPASESDGGCDTVWAQADGYPTQAGELPGEEAGLALPAAPAAKGPSAGSTREDLLAAKAARTRKAEAGPAETVSVSRVGPAVAKVEARRESPLLQLLGDLLQAAQQRGASSIHLEPSTEHDKLQVRLRIQGRLEPLRELASPYRTALPARIKALADLDVTQTRRAQQGRMPVHRIWPGLRLELEVAVLPVGAGLEDVILTVPPRLRPMQLDGLGLSSAMLDRMRSLVERRDGLWLCAGPARSGRTTALHALLAHLNRDDRMVCTVESSLNLQHPGVRQIEVSPRCPSESVEALRAAARAGSDVILVSDLGSPEVVREALAAVQDGHLVLGAVHARNSAEGVSRLMHLGADPWQLADALIGVHAPRLVQRLCNACRMSRPARELEVQEWADAYLQGLPPGELDARRERLIADWLTRFGRDGRLRRYHSPGCERCEGTGVRGRRALHELMVIDREARRLIRAGAPSWGLQRHALTAGMHSLRHDAIETMLAGWIASDEVRGLLDD